MKFVRNVFLAALMLGPSVLTAQSAGQPVILNNNSIAGLWYFFVTIDGAPPCQCISILAISPDGM